MKTLTIPKLELSAALVLAELVANLARIVPFQCEYHCWSDSTITVSWIRSSPSEFNVFVSNRVSKIQELTQGMTWHHVPTACNPSDILSRGCTPKELMNDQLWQHGPQFLSEPKSKWPTNVLPDVDLPERRRKVLITTTKYDLTSFCKYQNSFTSLQRIFAYIRKFWLTLSKKCTPTTLNLTVEDLRMSTYLFVKTYKKSPLPSTMRCFPQRSRFQSKAICFLSTHSSTETDSSELEAGYITRNWITTRVILFCFLKGTRSQMQSSCIIIKSCCMQVPEVFSQQ